MNLEISTDQSRLDQGWVVREIRASYWGGNFTPLQIIRAMQRSLCFGAYVDGKQVGYVRIVTDGSLFSSVCDVIVQEDMRGKGVGTALMTAAMEHYEVARTMCILRARPAAQLWYYKNWDFRVIDRTSGIMQREPK